MKKIRDFDKAYQKKSFISQGAKPTYPVIKDGLDPIRFKEMLLSEPAIKDVLDTYIYEGRNTMLTTYELKKVRDEIEFNIVFGNLYNKFKLHEAAVPTGVSLEPPNAPEIPPLFYRSSSNPGLTQQQIASATPGNLPPAQFGRSASSEGALPGLQSTQEANAGRILAPQVEVRTSTLGTAINVFHYEG